MALTSNLLTFIIVTLVWLVIGAGGPWLVPRSNNRGIVQVMIVMSCVCCWTFWLLTFLHQLNPLIGPSLTTSTIIYINQTWSTMRNIPGA